MFTLKTYSSFHFVTQHMHCSLINMTDFGTLIGNLKHKHLVTNVNYSYSVHVKLIVRVLM